MKALITRILLCYLLIAGVQASPITYQQINQNSQQPTNNSASQPARTETPARSSADETIPDFARLSDGRIVAFGPGVSCSEECILSEAFSAPDPTRLGTKNLNLLRVALPLVAASTIAYFVFGGDDATTPTITSTDTTTPQIVRPPTAPGADVPEPATVILVGIGLSFLVRRKYQHAVRA